MQLNIPFLIIIILLLFLLLLLFIFLFTSCKLLKTWGLKPNCPEEQSEEIAVKSQMSQIK